MKIVSDDVLKGLDKKYEEEINERRKTILKYATTFLLSKRCLESEKYHHYLVYIFPDDDYPKIMIQWDEKCIVCGDFLTDTDEEVKCHLCGRVFPRGYKIICSSGHYVCDECYGKYLEYIERKLLLFVFEVIFRNYDKLKELAEERAKEVEYYRDLGEFGKSIAMRNTIYSLLKLYIDEYFTDVEISMFTTAIYPDLFSIIKNNCLNCDEWCEPIKNLLKGKEKRKRPSFTDWGR